MNSNLQTSLYRTWKSMRYRCDNPRNPMFHNYGALGISYCPDWTSFHSFENWALKNGYIPGLHLERLDKTLDFTPQNCHWTTKNTRHYDSQGSLYSVWNNMCQRCQNPNHKSYKYYGKRGISVCSEWQCFLPFKAWAKISGYAVGLTLDRIDVDGNYSPENCRWSTSTIQCNNRRSNSFVTWNGQTKTLANWARALKVNRHLLWNRLHKYHMSPEQAFTMPVGASRGTKHHQKLITFNGITLNQKQWAERLGIAQSTLIRRLCKMSIKDALTKEK